MYRTDSTKQSCQDNSSCGPSARSLISSFRVEYEHTVLRLRRSEIFSDKICKPESKQEDVNAPVLSCSSYYGLTHPLLLLQLRCMVIRYLGMVL